MTKTQKIVLIAVCAILLVIGIILLLPGTADFWKKDNTRNAVGYSSETVRARVIAVVEEGPAEVMGRSQTYQVVEIQVLEGDYQQTRMMLEVGKSQVLPGDYLLAPGDVILASVGENQVNNQVKAFFVDFVREKSILFIFILFCGIVMLIGGRTGMRSLFGSLFGLAIIIFFVIPGILQGKDPSVISIVGSGIFL